MEAIVIKDKSANPNDIPISKLKLGHWYTSPAFKAFFIDKDFSTPRDKLLITELSVDEEGVIESNTFLQDVRAVLKGPVRPIKLISATFETIQD